MPEEFMLTTVDNPYDPFTQFDDWYAFDQAKGYCTSEYLARIAKTSQEISDVDNQIEMNRAIDDIIELNVLGIYRKYTKESFETIENRTLSEDEKKSLELLNEKD